jgi:hypothetical protein
MTDKRRLIYTTSSKADEGDYMDKVHRFASDNPHHEPPGVLVLREYRSNARPSLWRIEVQPWMFMRQEWCYQIPGETTEMVGPFTSFEACKVALLMAWGKEIAL